MGWKGMIDEDAKQLLHYVKNTHFLDSAGKTMFFDENGNPPAIYDVVNWQLTEREQVAYVTVGHFNSSSPKSYELIVNDSQIVWNQGSTQIPKSICTESCLPGYRKALRERQPVCCYDCIPCSYGEISNLSDSMECMKCPDEKWSNNRRDQCIAKVVEFLSFEDVLGSTLSALAIFSSTIPSIILITFIKYKNTPVVKANNRELSYLLLITLKSCFLSALIFIGQPTKVACLLSQATFGISFALCVSCVLAKTIMVIIAFKATVPNTNLRKWVGSNLARLIVFFCTGVQVTQCIIWLWTSPPLLEQNIQSSADKIILQCTEGSTVSFWCVIGYMGLLAILSFVIAFLGRQLPHSFNEAKYITFSMLVFGSVWLSFIPAYLSTRGKYMVAVEIFAILSSSAGLVICIFFPKWYIILVRPDMNSKCSLMGKRIHN
ncbi:extracellular calcium-sensing receptor-like [Protopterus annectens]|uniref:extracellular calcium-sensing receptor-like n=1 Tax=Protopterus annectens TaxID=7888 RepID=UPI001CFA08F3|nr:extracellular calcium-sensing receptor-like [Protopterus annectens]